MTDAAALPVVVVPLDSLRPHPRNYRTHPEDQLAHIARSIELHGFYRNVVVARDRTILAGHGVVTAARRLGRWEVPVVPLDLDPEEPLALSVLAGDNEIGRLAEVDDRALTDLLRELAGDDFDRLLGTGFDEAQLAALALVTRPASELADFAAAAEWVGLPEFDAAGPDPVIHVKFLTLEDRDRFLTDVLGADHYIVRRQGDNWTTWWPEKARNDLVALRFDGATEPGGGDG